MHKQHLINNTDQDLKGKKEKEGKQKTKTKQKQKKHGKHTQQTNNNYRMN